MQRRFPLILPFSLLLFTLVQAPVRAAVAEPDFREVASERVWSENLRPGFFQERAIDEAQADALLQIKAPYRAEDATVVPISIHVTTDQSAERYVRRIHVFIDKNPVPLSVSSNSRPPAVARTWPCGFALMTSRSSARSPRRTTANCTW